MALSSLPCHMPPLPPVSSQLIPCGFSVSEGSAHPADTPVTHICHTHSHSGFWHAASLIAQLHSAHFSPHVNTGQHPTGLHGQFSIIISSVSSGLFWSSAVALQVTFELIMTMAKHMGSHHEIGNNYCSKFGFFLS